MFDIDTLTKSMIYQPVVAGNQPNNNASIKENLDIANENDVHVYANGGDKTDSKKHDEKAQRDAKRKSLIDSPIGVKELRAKFEEFSSNINNMVNAISAPVNATGPNPTNNTNSFNIASPFDTAVSPNFEIVGKYSFVDPSKYPDDPDMPELEDIVYSDDEEDIDLPKGKRAIGSKWVFGNKKDERGIVIMNKARLVAQRHNQEEGIDYDEVFAPVARIEAIRLFLAYASFLGFMVYQIDVKSAFLYGTIKEKMLNQLASASTRIETKKPLLKDPDGEDVDVYIYRPMIGSLMYLTLSKPDIILLFVHVPDSKLLQKGHICIQLKGFL
nr:copia protein [Tanacetum cinerariifolium]